MSNIVWLIPLAPLIGCLACIVMRARRMSDSLASGAAIIGLGVAAIAALACLLRLEPGADGFIAQGYDWLRVGAMRIPVALRLDGISLAQINVVTFISLLVAIYSRGYMKGDPGYIRFFAVICGFVFSMAMLVLASNLLVLYAFWEGVGLCSYLLIGFWYQKPSAAKAAQKAFLVNRLADCGFLLGILLLWHGVGLTGIDVASGLNRLDFGTIFQAAPVLHEEHPTLLGWVGVLLLIGAIGKSAQFPFHVWLPDAMEGPTPVSALIHAATMVTAGVYLLARMSPLLQFTPSVLVAAGWLGAITALLAGLIALFQDDLKRVLAYSTVSQLGYLFLAFGAGLGDSMLSTAVVAAMFHLVTHAFFKALLFLASGNVMHAMGDVIDMRRFGGLKSVLPSTHVLFLIGALALVGLPPLAGFWSKEGILGLLAGQLSDPRYGGLFTIWLAIGLVSALLTAIYTFKAYFRTFHGATRVPAEAGDHAHEAPATMLAPLWVLAVGSVLSGLVLHFSGGLERLMLPIATLAMPKEGHHSHLWLAVVSVVLAALGIWVGKGWAARTVAGDKAAEPTGGFAWLGANRFFLDEIFDQLLVRPTQIVGRSLSLFDQYVIDGAAKFVSSLPAALGTQARRWQQGLVPKYALGMVVGLLAAIALTFFRG
jgi:NADH-quinone oxidoreductase subunit L